MYRILSDVICKYNIRVCMSIEDNQLEITCVNHKVEKDKLYQRILYRKIIWYIVLYKYIVYIYIIYIYIFIYLYENDIMKKKC